MRRLLVLTLKSFSVYFIIKRKQLAFRIYIATWSTLYKRTFSSTRSARSVPRHSKHMYALCSASRSRWWHLLLLCWVSANMEWHRLCDSPVKIMAKIYTHRRLFILFPFSFFSVRSIVFFVVWKAKQSQQECEIGCRSYLGVRTGCVRLACVRMRTHSSQNCHPSAQSFRGKAAKWRKKTENMLLLYEWEKRRWKKAPKNICAKSESRRAGVCVSRRVWEMRQQFLWRFFFFFRIYATFFLALNARIWLWRHFGTRIRKSFVPIVFSYLSITCVRAMAT